ncbi:MAG TPA: CYTH domain-containing protein, partial [Nitrolancea sp.]|nr:CYTH domain-containing protein [Nitrolancea sp.]
MSDSEDRIEAEWQFDLDDLASVESWLVAYPGSSQQRVVREASVEHLDTYFDTTDWRVHRAGYALRLRRRNDAAELTLKSLASRSATDFAARRELTEALAPSDDVTSAHLGGPVRERVRALRGRMPLIPLFSAITRRHRYGIWTGDLRTGELALDYTTFIGETFDDQSQLLRVEIESTNGETAALAPFVAELRAAVALEPAIASKFAIGLARNRLTPIGPPSLDRRSFDRDVSIGEIAYTTLWQQLVEVLRNEPGTRLGDDVEALHDMRVAVRRLRAALSLFKPYLQAEMLAQRDHLR